MTISFIYYSFVIEYLLYNNGTDSSLIQQYLKNSEIEIQDIMGRIYRACSRSGTLLIIFKGSEQLQISVKARQQIESGPFMRMMLTLSGEHIRRNKNSVSEKLP